MPLGGLVSSAACCCLDDPLLVVVLERRSLSVTAAELLPWCNEIVLV